MVGSLLTLKKRDRRIKESGISPALVKAVRILVTFHMVAFSFIFFRASSLAEAFYIMSHLLDTSLGSRTVALISPTEIFILMLAIGLLVIRPVHFLATQKKYGRYVFYAVVINSILFFSVRDYAPFIYFRF